MNTESTMRYCFPQSFESGDKILVNGELFDVKSNNGNSAIIEKIAEKIDLKKCKPGPKKPYYRMKERF